MRFRSLPLLLTLAALVVCTAGTAVCAEPEGEPDAELSKLRFTSVFGLDLSGRQESSIGEATVRGPIAETLRPLSLPVARSFAFDAKTKDAFTVNTWIRRIDGQSLSIAKLDDEATGRIPVMRDAAIALDVRRRQLLALPGGPWQYRYDIDAKTWLDRQPSWIPSEGGRIAYAADEDAFYVLSKKQLSKYNPDGEMLQTTELPEEFEIADKGKQSPYYLVAAQGSAIIVNPSRSLVSKSTASREAAIRVFGGVTGALRYSGDWRPRSADGKPIGFDHVAWRPESLDTRLDELAQRVSELDAGDAALATKLKSRIEEVRSLLQGEIDSISGVPQVHAVLVYEIRDEDKKASDAVPVQVDNFGQPVTLVLGSCDSLTWKVALAEGATIHRVILFGPTPQRLEGVPNDVTVTDLTAPSADSISASFSSDEGWDSRFASTLRLAANVDLVSVLSRHTYSATGPEMRVTATGSEFVRRLAEAAIRRIDRELVLAPLVGARFRGLHRTIESEVQKSYLADFTIEGPDRNSLKSLPKLASSLAINARDGKHFILAENQVFTVEPSTGEMKALVGDSPKLVAGLTFDGKRDRLLAWGEVERPQYTSIRSESGRLYSFDLSRKAWEEVSSRYPPLGAMVHDPSRDLLYALNIPFPWQTIPFLSMLNAHGASLDAAPLSEPLGWQKSLDAPQMLMTRGRIIVIMPPRFVAGEKAPQLVTEIYAIDPRSGRIARACSYLADR